VGNIVKYSHFFQRAIFIFLLSGVFLPLLAQEGSSASGESTESVLSDSTWTPSPSPTSTETPSPTPMPTEVTAEATEVATIESSATPELTPEVTEASAESTEAIVESTETLIVLSTTASPTLGADRIMTGRVSYQIGETHAGILIRADDGAGWESSAISDEQGIYEIALRSDRAFRLDFSATLYLDQSLWIVAGDSAPSVILLGGDLNGDTCINSLDLELLVSQFDKAQSAETDINLDGMTDVIDLVILTTNMNPDCELTSLPAANSSGTAPIENSLFPTATGIPANP
jgi:hypothetical protein